MDIHAIRLQNFRALFLRFANSPDEAGKPEYGRFKRFCEAGNLNTRYVSHVSNGRKNIGTELCRTIERGFDLPHGWMDQRHDQEAASQAASEDERDFIELALRLYRENPLRTQRALTRLVLDAVKTK